MSIPKKIHYCWYGRTPIPENLMQCISTWKKVLPEYEFKMWNEENSTFDCYFVKSALQKKKWASISDYTRFVALYNEGGIYLDTDTLVLKSFNDLLDQKCFIGFATKHNIDCSLIGTIKGHHFPKEIIKMYQSIDYDVDFKKFITGKIISDYIFNKYPTLTYGRIDLDDISFYPIEYFFAFPYCGKGNPLTYATEKSYVIHLWNCSWKSDKENGIWNYANKNYQKAFSFLIKAIWKKPFDLYNYYYLIRIIIKILFAK